MGMNKAAMPATVSAAILTILLAAVFTMTGCATSVNFTAPLQGRFATASIAAKNYEVIGTVSASSTEIQTVGLLGRARSVKGSKITFADLLQEAALIGADDIIDVQIDRNVTGRRKRILSYTGTALAIRYVDTELKMPDLIHRF